MYAYVCVYIYIYRDTRSTPRKSYGQLHATVRELVRALAVALKEAVVSNIPGPKDQMAVWGAGIGSPFQGSYG